MTFVLTYDVGTTGNKTCLYRIGKSIGLIESCVVGYPLHMTEDGGAEQHADDWWGAICESTQKILARTDIEPAAIEGIAFCCQMQGSVFVGEDGRALRNPMIYIDGRATEQFEHYLQNGTLRISGMNARKVLQCLRITGGVAATPKDPLWKYHWVREHEPEVFQSAAKWLDVKDYLVLRCTGRHSMTPDSAHITFLYDTRPGKLGWHAGLCRTYDVKTDHLPPVVQSTDVVGGLTKAAAEQMGLEQGTPVFGGGGDVSLISIGAGCLEPFDTHIYIGTSGWVVSNVGKRMVDITNFIASILGAIPQRYNYVAEQETSGICLQWIRDNIVLDGIHAYDEEKEQFDINADESELYERLTRVVDKTPPGAGGVIFTPWLHGNRAPREDSYARSMFFNIGLNTDKSMLIRAVLEGVAFHKRWMLEAVEKKIPTQKKVRFVGGGAKSETWCQIMADITGRTIETIARPQHAGAVGAAVVCGVGLGVFPSFNDAKALIPLHQSYTPRNEYRRQYDTQFNVFKRLYRKNRKLFLMLNKKAT